jgi:endonuclease YncB( thermonuclease family)
MHFLSILLLALLPALVSPAHAADLTERVVNVADGDTLTVLDADLVTHVVRLAGIDAPEKGQAFGKASRLHFLQRVIERTVVVQWHKRDRYRRVVGLVMLDGSDVNLGLVAAGLAWHYRAYEREQTADQRRFYQDAEVAANNAQLGLWFDSAPTPPWEWRVARSSAQAP